MLLLPGRDLLTTTDVAMLQLLWVTWMAQQAGQRWAVITTVNSVLLLDWFFVEPYNTLYVHQIDYLITFIVMLLRSISHDLRTPLATIMGASSMLADKELTLSREAIQQQAENIFQQSSLLSRHFDKVMELSRVQQPQQTLTLAELDVADIISAAISRRAQLLNSLPLQTALAGSQCVADSTLLEIALANMLENTVRHGAAPFMVCFDLSEGYYSLEVSNAPAPQQQSQRDSGTGLGTAICKAVMQLHNGQFTLQTSVDHTISAKLRWPQQITDVTELQHG
ncbi:MAG TPA: DUF4118 domain-containing protein [Rheinheimera sp.]|uniref:sensor histidine kinase n=1 Tax=Rheinheimera sp. TaxID=1869214 RepID=UPI002F93D471